jgi:hypothetical protein
MAMLDFLHAALLDPVQAALVLVVVLAYSGPLRLAVAAVAASVVSETIMAIAGAGYTWGEMMAPRLASSLAQAAVLCWIVGAIRPGRAGGASRQQSATSLAWHVRTFVRRRLPRLRER